MAFTKQTIKNRNLEFPSRYTMYDAVTAANLGEVDLIQTTGTIFEAGTKVDATLLQRYEDSLALVNFTIGTVQPTSGWWFKEI